MHPAREASTFPSTRVPSLQPRARGFSASIFAICWVLGCALIPAALAAQTPSAPQHVEVTPGISITLPAPWSIANRTANGVELTYPLSIPPPRPSAEAKPESAQEILLHDARIAIAVEERTDHAEAVERLLQIASEEPERPRLLVIGGWPALHRERFGLLPNPGEVDDAPNVMATFVTTAIAVGDRIVRFETAIADHADPALVDAVFQLAERAELPLGDPDAAQHDLATLALRLRSAIPPRAAEDELSAVPGAPAEPRPEIAAEPGTSLVQKGNGELEMVIAEDGLHMVLAANSGYSYSDNGGSTWIKGGPTPCIYNKCDGDPSLAIGKSGTVYFSWIGFPTAQPGGKPPNGSTDSLSFSTNNGHTFKFRSNAVFCPTSSPGICTLPDQEHIAADRNNLSSLGEDQVYLVFRNFIGGPETPRILCSSNGGKTWSSQKTIDAAGDFPRVTVGSDGSVYVAYVSGANMMLDKFSDCDSGLKAQKGFPLKVASYVKVACPVPGLDRCNNGNNLASPVAAVDDTDFSHIYFAFATNTSPSNDDVWVYDSDDGGKTWGTGVKVNKPATGRRFMPWVCAAGGIAGVTWYDRRFATKAADDLTTYFHAGAERIEPGGALQAVPETNLAGVEDPQCASGWPGGERSTGDATSCSTIQLAGRCQLPCANTKAGCPGGFKGTLTPCYFITSSKTPVICTAPETCQIWGGGAPKYGDYNGNACTPGINGTPTPTTCSAWASAKPPQNVDAPAGAITIYAQCHATVAPPVTITYHQVGACNGYTNSFGLVSAGSMAAYVVFGIESIDNSLGTATFNFDPTHVFVQQKIRDFWNPGLSLYTDILGPFAAIATTVGPGLDLKFSPSAFGATTVTTTLSNGAQEANMTPYFLVYNRKPGDPRVQFVKSDAKQTAWADTLDCRTITLH